MLSLLDQHSHIAFDFDDTLLYGVASSVIHEYIQNNPQKKYSIITHRTPTQATSIPIELKQLSPITIDCFDHVYPCPERTVREFSIDQVDRRRAKLPPATSSTPLDELSVGERKYLFWKGYVCARIGATIFIDDLPSLCEYGCDKYGVDLLLPTDLVPMG